MDPFGEVALAISNEAPEAGVARMALKRAHRDTEDSCGLLLVKQKVHACSATTEFVGRTNKQLKFARKVLPNLREK